MACQPREGAWYRDKEALLQEVEAHDTFAALAVAHGLSETTISKWWKKHGMEPRGPGPQPGYFKRNKEAEAIVHDDALTLDAQTLGDVEQLLRDRGLEPSDWQIVRVVVNAWEGFYKTDTGHETVPQKALKVTLRPALSVALLHPVVLEPFVIPPRPKVERAHKLVFIYGDDQRPNVDRGFEAAKLAWITEHQPDLIIDLGDGMDMPTISGHKPNPAANWSVQECLDDYGPWLGKLRCAAPNAEIVILADNHVARRLRDYQYERAAALAGVRPADIPGLEPDLEPLMSLRRMLRFDELNITYIDPPGDTHYAESQFEIVPGELVALHGYRTGANVGKKLLDDYGCSVVYGHTHGQDVHVTDSKRRGIGKRKRLYALGVGCGANVHGGGGFAPGSDWQNSALTVSVFPGGGWTFDQVNYEDGTLRWRDEEVAA